MQTTELISILIFAALGGVFGILATVLWFHWRSKQFRTQQDIPDLLGQWQCQWFDDAGDPIKPKIEDILEVQKWTHHGEFSARGHQSEFDLTYRLNGEVDASRVVTLVYKAARYPYEP